MAVRVRWTPLALADLLAARAWLLARSGSAERALVRDLARALARLCKHPRLGRVVPERRRSGWREIMLPPFRLVYALEGRELHVLRFWHSRRDPEQF